MYSHLPISFNRRIEIYSKKIIQPRAQSRHSLEGIPILQLSVQAKSISSQFIVLPRVCAESHCTLRAASPIAVRNGWGGPGGKAFFFFWNTRWITWSLLPPFSAPLCVRSRMSDSLPVFVRSEVGRQSLAWMSSGQDSSILRAQLLWGYPLKAVSLLLHHSWFLRRSAALPVHYAGTFLCSDLSPPSWPPSCCCTLS